MQTSHPTICINGQNYQSETALPENIRQAFDRTIASALKTKRSIFSGPTARFVPKLNSRIVCNSEEFGDFREMPLAERRLYEEAVAKLLPGYIAERVTEGETRLQRRNKLIAALTSLVITTSYLGFHGCFTYKFFIHFVRYLFGFTR